MMGDFELRVLVYLAIKQSLKSYFVTELPGVAPGGKGHMPRPLGRLK